MLVASRFLEGPNLYFGRPAVKATLDVSGLDALTQEQARAVARALGIRKARPGEPGSGFRAVFATRLVRAAVQRVGALGGSPRLAVRTRVGDRREELVVVVPWRHAGRVEAFCEGIGAVVEAMGSGPTAVREAIEAAGRAVAEAPLGRVPSVLSPQVPVVGITGTNGKTTTSRMIGHVARMAGRKVGWSSTAGVWFDGHLVDDGDYSGPGGARLVLEQEGIELGVLETARGGILRRGIGVDHFDVSVVTNVSEDHLGVDGVHTLDQLAEVKAVVPRTTARRGWAVLNADDPRVWAMRHLSHAKPWAFSRDAESPHVREALDEGGRATVVLDGCVAVLRAGSDPMPVVEVDEVPMALFGLSRANVENALAAASACLALGFAPTELATGLSSFRPDRDSDGRMNVWTLPLEGTTGERGDAGAVTVVVDMAHNEASFAAMLETCRALCPPGARLLLGIGASGDRSDESLVRLGEIAALGADAIVIKPPLHYLRGRSEESMVACFSEGLARAGQEPVGVVEHETDGLGLLLERARPGDVVAMMVHEDRQDVVDWLTARGGSLDAPETLRTKVRAAHG